MQTWHLPFLPATLHWSSLTLALEWRTDCLGVCGDKADIHSIVLGLARPLEAAGFFPSSDSAAFATNTYPGRKRVKGRGQTPTFQGVCYSL